MCHHQPVYSSVYRGLKFRNFIIINSAAMRTERRWMKMESNCAKEEQRLREVCGPGVESSLPVETGGRHWSCIVIVCWGAIWLSYQQCSLCHKNGCVPNSCRPHQPKYTYVFMQTARYFCLILTKLEVPPQITINVANTKFHGDTSCGDSADTDGS